MLEARGWRVIGPAPTVRAALRPLDEERPAVALLNVDFFGQSVAPVAAALKAASVPFAMASAYDRPAEMGGAAVAGAPHVGKPTRERRRLRAGYSMLAGILATVIRGCAIWSRSWPAFCSSPSDVVTGDESGIVVVNATEVEATADRAEERVQKEAVMMAQLREGRSSVELLNLGGRQEKSSPRVPAQGSTTP